MATEQRELDLVEKVDFRILGVSNNEEKLSQLLKLYLPPLLLKAGSEHASVRTKVCCYFVVFVARFQGWLLLFVDGHG